MGDGQLDASSSCLPGVVDLQHWTRGPDASPGPPDPTRRRGAEQNILVTGETGDPNNLIVSDQEPDGVAPTEPVTLKVATNCPEEAEEDDPDKKRKRRSSGGRRR